MPGFFRHRIPDYPGNRPRSWWEKKCGNDLRSLPALSISGRIISNGASECPGIFWSWKTLSCMSMEKCPIILKTCSTGMRWEPMVPPWIGWNFRISDCRWKISVFLLQWTISRWPWKWWRNWKNSPMWSKLTEPKRWALIRIFFLSIPWIILGM